MSLEYHSRASNGMGCCVPEDGIGEQQGLSWLPWSSGLR